MQFVGVTKNIIECVLALKSCKVESAVHVMGNYNMQS